MKRLLSEQLLLANQEPISETLRELNSDFQVDGRPSEEAAAYIMRH